MNKQNDDKISEKNMSDSSDESVLDSEAESNSLDYDGYIFKKPVKVKKTHSSEPKTNDATEKSENLQENPDDMVIFNYHGHHSHHSHHGHSSKHRSHRHHSHSHSRKHHRRKKMKLWKKILISCVSVLLAFVLIMVATVAILINKGKSELFPEELAVSAPDNVEVQDDGKYVVYNGDTYEFNENITNILCMGVDRRQIDTSYDVKGQSGQADVVIIVSIDTSTGKITLFNISRDTMTDVTVYSAGGSYVGIEHQQLCLSYAYGDGREMSCENVVSSVKKIFYNLPINTYFALDLDGIAAINDSIGGIDVVSPETISNFVEGGSYHLMGNDAELFVRSRNTSIVDSNNLRMKRQQLYLDAFMDKAINKTKQDIGTALGLYFDSSPYSCTNLNPSRVSYLAQAAITGGGSMSINTMSVPGEVKMGDTYAEFYVDEEKFYEMFLSVYYNKIT